MYPSPQPTWKGLLCNGGHGRAYECHHVLHLVIHCLLQRECDTNVDDAVRAVIAASRHERLGKQHHHGPSSSIGRRGEIAVELAGLKQVCVQCVGVNGCLEVGGEVAGHQIRNDVVALCLRE